MGTSGIALPTSFFTLIEGEGTWTPHVTLGKIRATKDEVGKASCTGSKLRSLAPAIPLKIRGLTMLGERPPRAWCDWDQALAFGALDTEKCGEQADDELSSTSESVPSAASAPSANVVDFCQTTCQNAFIAA